MSIVEIQRKMDAFMTYCNRKRSHQGYRLTGRRPVQALRGNIGLKSLSDLRLDIAAESITESLPNTYQTAICISESVETRTRWKDLTVGELVNFCNENRRHGIRRRTHNRNSASR